MTASFHLRPYRANDEDAAIALWQRTWQQAYPSIDFAARVNWWRERWRGELVPNAAIIVAEQDGALVGFVTIDASGYLDQLVVAPDRWGSELATTLVDEAKRLSADGITLLIGDPCVAVEKQSREPFLSASSQGSAVGVHLKSGAVVSADRLLVATGRRPNVEAWRATGIAQTERGWLKVDPATLEARAGIFGAGDVTGLGGFTHLAYYHGQVVARRLRGMDARADHTAVPRVTFTDPEIASVGLSEAVARGRGIDVAVARTDPAETARGYIHDFHGGALKLVGDRKRGVLIGATLVTPRAGEIVGELVLAIKLGTPLKTLADIIHPFPAFNRVLGESLDQLAAKVAPQSAARS